MPKRNGMPTPCEKRGYEVGDYFKVINHEHYFWKKGSVVQLTWDDRSKSPYFKDNKGEEHFIYLDKVRKLNMNELAKEGIVL